MISTPPIRVIDVGENLEGKVILIVEDHADLRRIMKEVLQYEGCLVLTAGNGREALDLLTRSGDTPHVILSDIIMDDIDGCELFRQLRTHPHWQSIPFVFVSGRTQLETACADDLPQQVDGYIEKPFTLGDLIAVVHNAIRA